MSNETTRHGYIFKSIFIDGSFLFHCSQQLNVRIDYRKLRNLVIGEEDHLASCTYYTALPPEYEMEDKHRAFLKLLKKELRIRVRSVPLMKIPSTQPSDPGYERYAKGEDIMLACDVIRGAMLNTYDTAVIVTGDGDFVPLVQQIQDYHGKSVQIVAFRSALSQALEIEATSVVYLDDHLEKIKWVSPQSDEKSQRGTFLGKIMMNKVTPEESPDPTIESEEPPVT